MKVTKETQIIQFEDNYQKVVINLNYTYAWLNNAMRREFEKSQLTVQQSNILIILRSQYPKSATVNFIKECMIDKMSDASRMINRLVKKGFVSRCSDKADRRAADIRISDQGLEILSHLDVELKTRDFISGNLTEEEAGTLSDLLDKMRGEEVIVSSLRKTGISNP